MRHVPAASALRRLPAAAIAAVILAGLAGAADSPPPGGNDADKIAKQLQPIEERLSALQEQEFGLMCKMMEMQQKANSVVPDLSKLPARLAKGERSSDIMKYKAILCASAQQVRRFDAQFLPLIKQVRQLQAKTHNAPDPIKDQVEAVATRVMDKHRANLEKIAGMYEQAGEWKPALAYYLQAYGMIPKAERLKEKELTESIADMYHRLGDYRHSLAFYKGLLEAKPEKQRYSDTKFAEKVADACVQGGDLKTALDIYRQVCNKISDKNEKGKRDRERILKKIERLKGRARE